MNLIDKDAVVATIKKHVEEELFVVVTTSLQKFSNAIMKNALTNREMAYDTL